MISVVALDLPLNGMSSDGFTYDMIVDVKSALHAGRFTFVDKSPFINKHNIIVLENFTEFKIPCTDNGDSSGVQANIQLISPR